MTVQFADGKWPGEIGSGVVMSDAAFDWVEPLVQQACAGWTSDYRYGVFELSPQDRQALAPLLRQAKGTEPQRALFSALSEWLEVRCGDDRPVSILGY